MAQLANLLKAEITRLARKEVRAEVEALKKASAQYRVQIAALKRQMTEQQRMLARLGKAQKNTASADVTSASSKLRFRTAGFASLRKKLGLSAAEMGKLLNVTQQTVYHWEKGQSKPRAGQLAQIAKIRNLGKRAVQQRLNG